MSSFTAGTFVRTKTMSLLSGIEGAPAMKSPREIIEPIEQADMCDHM